MRLSPDGLVVPVFDEGLGTAVALPSLPTPAVDDRPVAARLAPDAALVSLGAFGPEEVRPVDLRARCGTGNTD